MLEYTSWSHKNMGVFEMFFNIFKDINNLSDVNHSRGGIRRKTGDTKMAIVVILIFSMSGSRHSKHFLLLCILFLAFNLLFLWFSISLDYCSYPFPSLISKEYYIKFDKISWCFVLSLRALWSLNIWKLGVAHRFLWSFFCKQTVINGSKM